MGDVTLASAAIEDVRLAFPEAQIDLDILPPWNQLYAADTRFHMVHTYPLRSKKTIKRWRASVNWLKAMAQRRYDLILDLQTTDRSRLMIGLLHLLGRGAAYRAGNKPAWPYNLAPHHSGGASHALDMARATIGAAGIQGVTEHPILHTTPAQRDRSKALLERHDLESGHFAMFLPGSQAGGYLKRWGASRYATLAQSLLATGIAHVAVVGGPDEIEECARICELADDERVINLCGQTAPMDVPLIAAETKFIIGNDTGTAHLAAAGLRPLIVICGPTDPRRVLPAGPHVHGMQLDIPCINCYAKHCSHQSCMQLLSPQTVLQKLDRVV
jgi:ADP-heptose:LPS heptosyltransferase